jgi:4-hydroxybenzoate polyprenyltransferase
VVVLVALVAGAALPRALALGASMVFLQFAIGALNDLVDVERDRGRRVGKPIPDGLITPAVARVVVLATAGIGLLLSLVGGPLAFGLAVVGLGVGVAYDLRARGTTLSWLPFAIGIPLLPVYGWLGATGTLPGVFLVLVPAAANAGTALAIANAVVDLERDEAAGTGSIAIVLGPGRAAALVLGLHAVVAALAVGTAAVLDTPGGWLAALLVATGAPLAGATLGLVAVVRGGTALRQLAWEIQAVGTGLLAVAWLAALSASTGAAAGV